MVRATVRVMVEAEWFWQMLVLQRASSRQAEGMVRATVRVMVEAEWFWPMSVLQRTRSRQAGQQ
jgi:hypothetical protein